MLFLTDFFEHDAENKGPASELIKQVYDKTPDEKVAYLGAEVALGADVPAYVHCAYRNVLKISAARTKIYKKPFNSETPYYWNTLPVDFRRCGGIP